MSGVGTGVLQASAGRGSTERVLDGYHALEQVLARAGYPSVVAAVAAHTGFLHPETVAQTRGQAVFPVVRAPLNTARRRVVVLLDGRRVWADDNGPPTDAFLWAAERRKGRDVQFCHVWARSDSVDAYTALWNLCATPAFLAKTTDTDPVVRRALRHRAWELFGVQPEGEPDEGPPPGYEDLAGTDDRTGGGPGGGAAGADAARAEAIGDAGGARAGVAVQRLDARLRAMKGWAPGMSRWAQEEAQPTVSGTSSGGCSSSSGSVQGPTEFTSSPVTNQSVWGRENDRLDREHELGRVDDSDSLLVDDDTPEGGCARLVPEEEAVPTRDRERDGRSLLLKSRSRIRRHPAGVGAIGAPGARRVVAEDERSGSCGLQEEELGVRRTQRIALSSRLAQQHQRVHHLLQHMVEGRRHLFGVVQTHELGHRRKEVGPGRCQ
ncbi:MAG: hypothetical protein ABMA64_11810 [Myxococcota bacterium]